MRGLLVGVLFTLCAVVAATPGCPYPHTEPHEGIVLGPNGCPQGFSGAECADVECFGKVAPLEYTSHPGCGSNGKCVGKDECVCKTGFRGKQCEQILCNGVFGPVEGVSHPGCSNTGRCITGQCVCDFGFGGMACEKVTCFGREGDMEAFDHAGCHGHGRCVSMDACVCNGGFSGAQCQLSTCNSKTDDADKTQHPGCGSLGKCTSSQLHHGSHEPEPAHCVCKPPYTGDACDMIICNEFDSSPSNMFHPGCSGHGLCLAGANNKGECECTEPYSGVACEEIICNGQHGPLKSPHHPGCSGIGRCVYNDADNFSKCECPPGREGVDCGRSTRV